MLNSKDKILLKKILPFKICFKNKVCFFIKSQLIITFNCNRALTLLAQRPPLIFRLKTTTNQTNFAFDSISRTTFRFLKYKETNIFSFFFI